MYEELEAGRGLIEPHEAKEESGAAWHHFCSACMHTERLPRPRPKNPQQLDKSLMADQSYILEKNYQ